jgi:hypothetical protein
MVREAIISAATLAGLVGLACYYGGNTDSLNRVARAADQLDFIDFNVDEVNDAIFAEDFEIDMDDVSMFQEPGDSRAGGAKKQIPGVKNCMKNAKCIARAQASVRKWASSSQGYITANPARLLKPINSGWAEAENDFGFCTPNDDAVPCDGASEDPLAQYKATENTSPKTQLTANPSVQAIIDSHAESQAMQDALDRMTATGSKQNNNAFKNRAAKVFLVIPNGIPVSMPTTYGYRFGNYWRWFKAFNTKYIGIGAGKNSAPRVNMHMWFLRQDKVLKSIMKTPAKTSNKFPWRRFDSIMLPNQNTAAQPKLAGTFEALWETIDNKGMSSDAPAGQDCFTIWFHQYIPADVLDLSDSLFQEETMAQLEKACTIIHVWVGAQELGDAATSKVIQYVQGLMQPEQLTSTSADVHLRRYYYVKNLEQLGKEEGQALMDKIYNDIAIERSRATCLFAQGGTDLGAVFEANQERYDEYYTYGDATTTASYDFATSAGAETTADLYDVTYAAEEVYDYAESTTAAGTTDYGFTTTTEEPAIPDWRCCGIGFSAKKYDANVQACCEDGSVAATEADCFLL